MILDGWFLGASTTINDVQRVDDDDEIEMGLIAGVRTHTQFSD